MTYYGNDTHLGFYSEAFARMMEREAQHDERVWLFEREHGPIAQRDIDPEDRTFVSESDMSDFGAEADLDLMGDLSSFEGHGAYV